MIRVLFASALAAAVLWCGGVVAHAEQQLAGAEDAKAMLERAVAALKAGEAPALAAFNDASNKDFHDRDLFVFCYGMSDGKITAYSSPGLLGIDVRTLTLKDDPIGQRAYDTVANAPEGSVADMEYNFPKPGSSTPVPKQTLETRVGDQGCGVAYYK
jgi:hypothetical protein